MKKIILSSLVVLFSLSLMMPVLANENKVNKNAAKQVSAIYQPRTVTVRGNITAVSGSALPADITVKLEKITPNKLKNYPGAFPMKENAVIVHLAKDAKIVRKYMGKAHFSELAVGDKLSVTGKLQADGSVSASMVKDESIKVIFYAKKGVVMAIDTVAGVFTIKNDGKEFKIFVTANTKFSKAGLAKSTLADLKINDAVVVRGVVRQLANEVSADSVAIKIGEKEKVAKQLESKKIILEKKIEVVKSNLAKLQTELEVLLKKLSEATAINP